MKKTVFIFCTFCIFIFTFSVFNGLAQVDSLVNQSNISSTLNDRVLENANNKRNPLDSVQVKKHSPKKASWLAIVPGAGQIYNKKYWKLPIVYSGLGASGFLIYYYADLTTTYKKEYVARMNDDVEKLNPKLADDSNETIYALRNSYRRNMEISVAACAIVYFLSILDASVDAHLFYYDVSDNLSLGIKPKLDFNPITRIPTPSLALVLKF